VTFACCAVTSSPASAGVVSDGACKVIGDINTLGGKACDALRNPGQLLKTGKSLISGHIGSAIKEFLGSGGASSASTALGLAALVAWVVDGARAALRQMAKVVNETAAPQLGSVWFSSTYWRMAAIAALLTLPFLFAAAIQALVRSDVSLLARAAFGHLPLALVAVGIAAPVTMLLLSGTDELCALVWSPGSANGLTTALAGGGIARVVGLVDSPFLAFLLCLFTAGAGMCVWLELAMREAAVYIVVLILPLAFAALVWPARRVWAIRAVEMLVALILSKFAIVAVLGLGGAALDHIATHGLGAMLAGMVLVLLAAFAPWAVLRLVPLAEVASSAAGSLRSHAKAARDTALTAGRIEQADALLSGIASHVANLARPSGNGRTAGPDLAMRGGYSSNGRDDHSGKGATNAERAPYDWEEEALEAATAQDGHEGEPQEEEARRTDRAERAANGMASRADSADLAADASGVDRASRMDRAYLANLSRFADEESAVHSESAAAEERVPGADPLWQAPDMSWRPLTLGLDEGWPPDPPWPAEEAAAGQPEDASGVSGGAAMGPGKSELTGGSAIADEPSRPSASAGGAEQSEPLPPVQDRGRPL
jgi:hypothetical protein